MICDIFTLKKKKKDCSFTNTLPKNVVYSMYYKLLKQTLHGTDKTFKNVNKSRCQREVIMMRMMYTHRFFNKSHDVHQNYKIIRKPEKTVFPCIIFFFFNFWKFNWASSDGRILFLFSFELVKEILDSSFILYCFLAHCIMNGKM